MSKVSLSLSREQKKDVIKVAFILLAICAACALALSLVNEITRARIEDQRKIAFEQAMNYVLPAEAYDHVDISAIELDKSVSEVYEAKDSDGTPLGYCVKSAPLGFAGEVQIVVGIDNDDKITRVDIVSMSETPGLGTKAKDEKFLSQYAGKAGIITVVKGEASAEENEISAITGATVTSKAVTSGVQAALDAVALIKGGASNAQSQ
ncbi:MAG: RnfABCDGE type electron transport complex subunit G [Clostridiales bacterium]|jgi:electron transport complex protein RnfG|nr:RnfABCDGE type electron transport complex subunit G [Clostridiales bacterium]